MRDWAVVPSGWRVGVGGEATEVHGDRATAWVRCRAHLSGLHPEGSWEDEWAKELELQKDVEEVLLGPKLGGGGWRLGEQVGAWFPCQEGGWDPLSSAPRDLCIWFSVPKSPCTTSLQMALSGTAFDGGAAGAHGQRPVPRTQGEQTPLL